MPIRVVMIQPVVPHYRVPLFTRIAQMPEFDLRILASPRAPYVPDSVAGLPEWIDLAHPCSTFAFGQLFWQRDLQLPKDFGPGDVLVFNGNPRFASSALPFAKALRRGAGTVWWGHGWSPTSVPWRAWLRRRLMRLASVVLLYTDDEVTALRAQGHHAQPVLGLNNTIDITASRDAAQQWDAARLQSFRCEQGIEGARVLLFTGRLRVHPSTELDVALQALARLRASDARWRLVVIGKGEDEERLRALQSQLQLHDAVLWAGSIYDEQQLAPWFLCAEYFVYPGPIGLGVLHAFAYGLPVVTHSDRRAHNPEISALREGENGLLFARGDAESLAQCLRAAPAGSAREQLGAAALETVTTTYGFDAMVQRFAEAIRLASRASLGVQP